jgi:NAD(P)-dependent dehydrogenase (short-subunit alcohol dehydrogenase family)
MLSRELGPRNITANALSPRWVTGQNVGAGGGVF